MQSTLEGTKGRRRHPHQRQRGNVLVVVLIALTGLAALGSLTAGSVQGGLSTSSATHAHAIAVYAAEAGASAAMDFLSNQSFSQYEWFSNNIRASNIGAETPSALPGNEVLPGDPGNVFSADMQAWYRVTLYNNETDRNFTGALADDSIDSDGRVIVHSTGFGPDGATATVEVEVQGLPVPAYPPGAPIPPRTLPRPPQFLDGLAVLSWREVE